MKKILVHYSCYIFLFFLFSLPIGKGWGWAVFSQTQTFKSSRIKINNYGTREQTSTFSPNIITLDLRDSLIIIQPDHEGIKEFLGYQNQFEISGIFGTGITTRVFFTSSEYVFTFDSKMRVIVISKKEISPQIHSVWLEEITSTF